MNHGIRAELESRSEMTVVLTGGCGLVGANLLRRLLEDPEAEVIVLDLSAPDELLRQFLGTAVERARFIRADVSSAEGLAAALSDVDTAGVRAIVHGAILDHVPQWERDNARAYVDVNLGGTINVLEWARRLPALDVFVYVGSGSVYGEPSPGCPTGRRARTVDGSARDDAITKSRVDSSRAATPRSSAWMCAASDSSGVFGPIERPTSGRRLMSPVHALARAAVTDAPLRITARTWTRGRPRGALRTSPMASLA